MDINKIRSRYITDCLKDTTISNEVLGKFTRYLFSKQFPKDLQEIAKSSRTPEEKQGAFNEVILRKGIPERYQN